MTVGRPTAAQTVDESARTQLIAVLAARLAEGYVIPEMAGKMSAALREAETRGTYGGIDAGPALAKRLTDDLRAISQDKHLAVFYQPEGAAGAPSSDASRDRFNAGYARVERLPGNVGYLDLRNFSTGPRAEENAAAAMTLLADTDAVILDLRENGGGSTVAVNRVASYFFARSVHLTDLEWRDEHRTVEVWTDPSVPGRHVTTQYVFILTSARTWSAAEDFCYAFKALKRATLVGERTGGGAHSGRGITRLTPLFTAFIPVGRSLSPITKTNWERVGVEPDVAVAADRALSEAHVVALRRLIEKEADDAWRRDLRETLADLIGAPK